MIRVEHFRVPGCNDGLVYFVSCDRCPSGRGNTIHGLDRYHHGFRSTPEEVRATADRELEFWFLRNRDWSRHGPEVLCWWHTLRGQKAEERRCTLHIVEAS